MGILDATVIPKDKKGRRLDSFEVQEATMSPRVAAWNRLMREATGNTDILVIGDSTGAGLTRWARLLCNRIAAQYPAWTVVYAPFDDPTKTYKAGDKVTVQTGTNGKTVTLYNASLSGSAIAYARDNMTTITTGVAPDMILVNYGHNSPQLTDDYRAVHAETVQRYAGRYPAALMVLMTQNPRAATDAAYADDQGRQRAVYEYGTANGFVLVDVNEAFRLYGNYAADLLLVDGLHPNDNAGSPLWADLVWAALKPTGVTIQPGNQQTSSRIWLPADVFHAVDGTPTQGVNFGQRTWAFNDSADQSVATSVDIPSAWKRQNIHTLWTAAANGTGAVVFSGNHMYLGPAGGIGGSITIGTWSASGGVTTNANAKTSGITGMDQVWNRIAFGVSPVALKVGRTGTSASDTLPGDALFLGVMIDRAF